MCGAPSRRLDVALARSITRPAAAWCEAAWPGSPKAEGAENHTAPTACTQGRATDKVVFDARRLFYADVQRGNATGQITVFDFGEADGTHQLGELTLGRNLA